MSPCARSLMCNAAGAETLGAQRLIASGRSAGLAARWAVPRKAGETCRKTPDRGHDDAELRFVSRGGLKREAAIAHCASPWAARSASTSPGTGGSACPAAQGATRLSASRSERTDHPRIAADERVSVLEGVTRAHKASGCGRDFDLIGGDRRYLAGVGAALMPLMRATAAAVKPQSAQRVDIGRAGRKSRRSSMGERACARPETVTAVVRDCFSSAMTA